MSKAPESVLVDAIRRAIRSTWPNSLVIKVHGSIFQATGIPDLLVFVDGACYPLEIKRQRAGESMDHARGRCSTGQREMIRKFRAVGIPADVVISPAEAVAVIRSGGNMFFYDPEIYTKAELEDWAHYEA